MNKTTLALWKQKLLSADQNRVQYELSLHWTLHSIVDQMKKYFVLLVALYFTINMIYNSLWPSDAIWHHWSILVHVIPFCLKAPSHYLNQHCLLISEVFWHSLEGHFTGKAQDINLDISLKITNLRLLQDLPGTIGSPPRSCIIHVWVQWPMKKLRRVSCTENSWHMNTPQLTTIISVPPFWHNKHPRCKYLPPPYHPPIKHYNNAYIIWCWNNTILISLKSMGFITMCGLSEGHIEP